MGHQVHGPKNWAEVSCKSSEPGVGMREGSIYSHLDHHTSTEVPKGGKERITLSLTLWNSYRAKLKWPLLLLRSQLTGQQISSLLKTTSPYLQSVLYKLTSLPRWLAGEGLFSPATNSWCLPISDLCISKYCSSAEFLSKLEKCVKRWLCSSIAQYSYCQSYLILAHPMHLMKF